MNLRQIEGLTFNYPSVAMVAGTTSTITTTVTSGGVIGGKFVTAVTALTNSASPTLDVVTGLAFPALVANQNVALVIGWNAAGTLKMAQGPIAPTAPGVTTTAGAFLPNGPVFPAVFAVDDFVPAAYTVVRTSPTGNAFTAGTTAWAASGITTLAFVNVCTLPDRPQTT